MRRTTSGRRTIWPIGAAAVAMGSTLWPAASLASVGVPPDVCLRQPFDAIVTGTVLKPLAGNVFTLRVDHVLAGEVPSARLRLTYFGVSDSCHMYVPSDLAKLRVAKEFVAYIRKGGTLPQGTDSGWHLVMMLSPATLMEWDPRFRDAFPDIMRRQEKERRRDERKHGGAIPRGNPASWVTNDDYPSSALRAGATGLARILLTVAADGKASGCRITRSTGDPDLDTATCRTASRRARFKPPTRPGVQVGYEHDWRLSKK